VLATQEPTKSPFDRIAAGYDTLWTNTATGRLQREAVWRRLAPLYRAGQNVLDLGCGTGEDALHLERAGIHVSAFDASFEMVRIARQRGVAADVLALEELSQLKGCFDGALSNFGALNCVEKIENLRGPLARLIRPGGFLALCVIGRFCLRETVHYFARGEFRKGARRWSGASVSRSLALRVFYPSIRQISNVLAPDFRLIQTTGIGVFIPPSYVQGFSKRTLRVCAAADRCIAHLPGVRALSDHRLLVFVRC
jgi:ubiquinone/menaquinone biosynthesis C-methylase UbiE